MKIIFLHFAMSFGLIGNAVRGFNGLVAKWIMKGGDLVPEGYMQLVNFWPIALMFVVMYFIVYRPQKNQEKKRKSMLDSLKKGDRVITVGGIYGTITAFDADKVTLKVAEKTELVFSRSSIASIQGE
ncbi:MAG: preprotein translocase, YajC subunit [Firmicutes bacterium]|nr:preprotein translocase, YajC subunit [Bacillota bacterium]